MQIKLYLNWTTKNTLCEFFRYPGIRQDIEQVRTLAHCAHK